MRVFNFFKDIKEKKELNKILDKVEDYQRAKDLVNKAISYRNINQMGKALQILKKVLNEYPKYKAANLVYGNTLRRAGRVDEALNFFYKLIEIDNGTGAYNPKEIYANIGSIYFFEKDDSNRALENYNLALKAPDAPDIDAEGKRLIISSVYRDLAYVYFILNDYNKSKAYAEKRLSVQTKCAVASKILGLSKINKFISGVLPMEYFDTKIQNSNIVDAIEKLNIAFEQNDKDYAVINGLTLGYYLLLQMPYYNTDEKINESLNNMHDKFFNTLEVKSKTNDSANHYFDMYNNLQMNIGIQILKHQHPGLSIEIESPGNE